MRIAAVSLPNLRVEVVRAAASASSEQAARGAAIPLGIVVAAPPMTEAKLLGNTRLDVVSPEARVLGVRPGQTIAQARARASNLAVRVVRPEAVRGELARLAEVALAFGATVAFSEAGAIAPASRKAKAPSGLASHDVLWVDVTGCAHLHALPGHDGEAVLGARLARVLEGLGHTCAVAIADGPRVAAILAAAAADARAAHAAAAKRKSHRAHHDDGEAPIIVVPPGKNAVALAPLPTSVLPLAEGDVRWLHTIGVRTVAELRALPRAALAARLGAQAPVVLTLAEGDDRAPLDPYSPPEIPEEEATLEYGVEGADALTFVTKALTDRLAVRLASRAVAAARLELDLAIDVALLPEAERGSRVQRLALDLPVPLSSASDLLAALRPKIERFVLRAPVLGAKLRAPALVHKPQAALALFEAQPKAERALPRLVAELASDLGEEAVGRLVVGDAWAPEDRSRFVRLTAAATGAAGATSSMPAKSSKAEQGEKKKPRRHMLSSIPEPSRILAVPLPVARDAVKIVRHLSRLEAIDWWKRVPGDEGAHRRGVDYVYAWVEDAPAWVELDRATRAARVRGWFD